MAAAAVSSARRRKSRGRGSTSDASRGETPPRAHGRADCGRRGSAAAATAIGASRGGEVAAARGVGGGLRLPRD